MHLPLFAQAAALFGLAGYVIGRSGTTCTCVIGQSPVDSRLLEVLEHQLERCGPQHLCASFGRAAARLRFAAG